VAETDSARAVPNRRHVHGFDVPAGGVTTTNFASSVYGGSATSVGTATAAGSATTVSRSDHAHDLGVGSIDAIDLLTAAVAAILSPPGAIVGYGGAAAPTGWLLCNGAAVSRTTHAALFTAIGTTYGVGDGSTTFNVPDLRQRFPLGKAASGTGATLGGTGGLIDHIHALDTTSSHARLTISVDATANDPRIQRKTVAAWTATHNGGSSGGGDTTAGNTTGLALGGDSDVANPPFQVVNFLIRTS
jgi:microcystin-dependent protein